MKQRVTALCLSVLLLLLPILSAGCSNSNVNADTEAAGTNTPGTSDAETEADSGEPKAADLIKCQFFHSNLSCRSELALRQYLSDRGLTRFPENSICFADAGS